MTSRIQFFCPRSILFTVCGPQVDILIYCKRLECPIFFRKPWTSHFYKFENCDIRATLWILAEDQPESGDSVKKFTLDEVGKLNSPEGEGKKVLIVIHDKVYDVTEFLDDHPGGREILMEKSGTVASQAFDDIGHSGDAKELMKSFVIGELVEAEAQEGDKEDLEGKFGDVVNEASENKENLDKKEDDSNDDDDTNWKSYILPALFTLLASGIYRLFSR